MIQVIVVRSFTRDPSNGNPAGVVFAPQPLFEARMIEIAQTLGFSETAFVYPSRVGDLKIVFATPTQLVPFCGHATIAAFHVWFSINRHLLSNHAIITSRVETLTGQILTIQCHFDGRIEMTQQPTQWFSVSCSREKSAQLLGLPVDFIRSDIPIEMVSTGTPKLLIPLVGKIALDQIQPNLEQIRSWCEANEGYGVYAFYQGTGETFDFEARQFNPRMGINEDPITGVAGAALGAYAQKHRLSTKPQLVVRQGYHLGRGGEMYIALGEPIQLGGYAIIEQERWL